MDFLDTRFGKVTPVRAEGDRLIVNLADGKGHYALSVHDCLPSSRQAFVDLWNRLGGPEQKLAWRKDDGTLVPFEPKA